MSLAEDLEEEEWFCAIDKLSSESFPVFEEIRSMGKLCDVTLVCSGNRFTVHRIVLAATIPYFKAMFTNDMAESEQNEISIRGIEPEVLELLINFAYTGRVRITAHNVQSLHIGAAFLQLKCISDACSSYLIKRLNSANVLSVRNYAQMVGADNLVNSCDLFISKHFACVRNSDEFMSLTFETVVEILSRDDLHVNSEEIVFDTALSWVKQDWCNRSQHMADLLGAVRLPLLNPPFLTDRVASEEVVKNCLRCRDLVDEAKDYHLMPERRPLLQSFRTKPRCCNNIPGTIYAVGGLTNTGDSLSTVEKYNDVLEKWELVEPMTTLRSRVGVAVMNRKLYAIGGFNGHERLRTVEMFDPDTRKWSEVAPLKNKRSALGAAVIGERIYVCGGYDGVSSLASVEWFSGTGEWCLTTPMIKQRSAAGIAVLDGKIFVIGGHDGMSIFGSVECFDPATERWSMVQPMKSRRCRLGATACNGKIYVAGGYDGQKFLQTVECYDPFLDQWSELQPMNVKRSRVALVANMGKFYCVGGYDGISNLSSTEIFDINESEEPEWKFGASMIAHEGGVGVGVIPVEFQEFDV